MRMKIERLLADFLIILSVAFTLYIIFIMRERIKNVVLKDAYRIVFRFELLACAFLILFALDLRFHLLTMFPGTLMKMIGWILRIIVILMVFVLLFFSMRIIINGRISSKEKTDTALVLGLALENGKANEDLLRRLDRAKLYLQENPNGMIILSGGNPDGMGNSEAALMAKILKEKGVSEDRMILEEEARSTKENFENVTMLIDPKKPLGLITSDYHMDRALRMAGQAGFEKVLPYPSRCPWFSYGANVLSEVILAINEVTFKR